MSILVSDYIDGLRSAATKAFEDATGLRTDFTLFHGLSGSTAAIGPNRYSGGFSLYMPPMPPSGRLTRKEQDGLTGYWLHEVLGHAVHTDFSVWETAVQEGLHMLVNGLEDVLIERKAIASGKHPNMKHYLETLCETLTYQMMKETKGFNAYAMPENLPAAIAFYGRVELLGYNIPSLPPLNTLPQGLQDILRGCFNAIRKGKTTQDMLNHARTLKAQQQQQQSQDGAGDKDSNQDSDSQGDSQGDNQKGQGDANAASGEGQSVNADGGKQDGKPSKDSGGGSSYVIADTDDMNSAEPDMSKTLERFTDGMPKSKIDRMNSSSTDISNWSGERFTPHKFQRRTPVHSITEIKGRLQRVARLRNDVKNLVVSPERIWKERFRETGRFDTRAIGRLRSGRTNVFKQRFEDDGQDAAVYFLLDISPSMGRAGIADAACLALHMASAVEAAGARCEIAAFGDATSKADAVVHVAKPFNKRVRACSDTITAMASCFSNGTNMSPAIPAAARKLKKENASRHILFVLADGQCGHGTSTAAECVRVAEAMGVEVIGMGVGNGAVRCIPEAFPDHVLVGRDINDMGNQGLKQLARKLHRKPKAAA